MEYHELYSRSSCGGYGSFGLKIEVAASRLPDLDAHAIQNVAYDAARKIEAEVMAASIATDPKTKEASLENREQIVGLFEGPIYVEEIPNGYCPDWCCRHLPWFVVTTSVGRFKVGWRKRVLNIDWTEVPGAKVAYDLFDGEGVTMGEGYIHAWSLETARRYISTVVASVPGSNTKL